MNSSAEKPKHQQVYEQLVKILVDRNYKIGDKLPSERDFAEELNVNVLTVRRAFRDLIAADFVTKRVGSGTYLNRTFTADWQAHAVNLVIDTHCTAAVMHLFEKYGKLAGDNHSKDYRLIFSSESNIREVVHTAVQYSQPTIFCGTYPMYSNFAEDVAKMPSLFVAVGALPENNSIPAVISNDYASINMLMDKMQSAGHTKIAFFTSCGKNSASIVGKQQRIAWQEKCGKDYDPIRFHHVTTDKQNYDQIAAAYTYTKENLLYFDFTAALCMTDEIMFGVSAALREAGLKIPEDISIASVGNTNLSRFSNPPVTSVDMNIKSMMNEAFKLLFHNLENPENIEMKRITDSIIMERKSIQQYKKL